MPVRSTQFPSCRDRAGDVSVDELVSALLQLVVAGAAANTEMARRMDFSTNEYLALIHVTQAEAVVGPGELGRLTGMSSGSATGLVDRLVERGHLSRSVHHPDRRRVHLTPTRKAIKAVNNLQRPLVDSMRNICERFAPAERATISNFVAAVTAECFVASGADRHSEDRD